MNAPNDKVVQMPTRDERVAARAAEGLAEYKAGLADEGNGRLRALLGLITYASALMEGRELAGGNDKAFGQWVKANGLDQEKPFDQVQERSNAMEIARLSTLGTTPKVDFSTCPYTRPTHIMTWYRATYRGTSPTGQLPTAKRTKAIDVVKEMAASGELLTGPTVAARANVSATLALKAILIHRKDQEAKEAANAAVTATVATVTEDQALAAANFSEKSKLTIADAVRIHTTRLNKQFEAKVFAEVRRRIDTADDFVRKSNKEMSARLLAFERERGKKGVFSIGQFNLLLKCLDSSAIAFRLKEPDRELVQRFDEAMRLVRDNRDRLINPEKKD